MTVKDIIKENEMKTEFKTWFSFFKEFMFNTPYYKKLTEHLHNERILNCIYPEKEDVFKCFRETNINNLKVIILGSEPNIDGTGNGLALGTNESKTNQRTLDQASIFNKAIEKDLNILSFNDPSMNGIANQGVLLLNSSLTTIKNMPLSHAIFWRLFVKYTLIELSKKETGIIYVLLGKTANTFTKYIDVTLNYVFHYDHPETIKKDEEWKCDMFSKINQILLENNGKEYCIDWR